MSAINTNPAVAEALSNAEQSNNIKEHVNTMVTTLGNSMKQDTFEMRGPAYTRKNFTVGALLAYDPEVRRLAQRAGVDLRRFDDAVNMATQAILAETSRRDTIGEKVAKVLRDTYQNGGYR